MSGESVQPSREQKTEHEEVIEALSSALSIAKANRLSREEALGIVSKLLQPISPNSF